MSPAPVTVASESKPEGLFYTRSFPWSDPGGPYPLRVVSDAKGNRSYELERSPGQTELFDTAKSFFEAVHGPDFSARHWTMDRYLGLGRHTPPGAPPGIIVVGPMIPVGSSAQETPATLDEKSSGLIQVPRSGPSRPRPTISIVRAPTRGIDLEARGDEVAKLLYAGFSHWIFSSGYDFEDVLQEVYRKILVSNAGRAPWDPTKSSFGHYVHMVCRSALSNFHRKKARIRSKEHTGIKGLLPDGSWGEMDVRDSQRACTTPSQDGVPGVDPAADLQRYILNGPYRAELYAPLAAQMVPYIQAGYTLKDTAAHLGVDRPRLSKAMRLLKACAAQWAH